MAGKDKDEATGVGYTDVHPVSTPAGEEGPEKSPATEDTAADAPMSQPPVDPATGEPPEDVEPVNPQKDAKD